ncbi:hypothetical protein HLI18_23965 [Rhizobium laguerreae]|uniref:hypothetical protein n=1 Tax=Rhizobium laguerreae TaxID=1076926 RepID=UPI0018595EE4|nr:hypothetical protein [Rhizobium laguerreae]
MVDRLARVVAKLYGQAGRSISRPVSANPPADLPGKSARLRIAGRTYRFAMAKRYGRWAGHLSARIRGDRLGRTKRYALRQSPLP